MEKDRKKCVLDCEGAGEDHMRAFVFVRKHVVCGAEWNSPSHAYLGWEHISWVQRAPPRWYRPSTDYCWRDRV